MVRAEQSTTLFDQFLDGRLQTRTAISRRDNLKRVMAAMNAGGGARSEDYSTVDGAENKAFPSLVRTTRQAWHKLTTHRAFVTITSSLETEFPG